MRMVLEDGDVASSNVDGDREGGLDDRIADEDFVVGDETSRWEEIVNSAELVNT